MSTTANIYQKPSTTDKMLILDPGQYFMRPINMGNWTELRIGMYLSGVAATGDNAQNVAETLALSNASTRYAIGLKTHNSNLPGTSGTDFIGLTNSTNAVSNVTDSVWRYGAVGGSYSNRLCGGAFVGTSITTLATVDSGIDIPVPSGTTSYSTFYALRFVITDRGLSSQTVSLSFSRGAATSTSDYSEGLLNGQINNATYTSFGSALAWNNGSVAYDIPNAVFVRIPFIDNKLRITAISVMKIAPYP